jgi:DNA-binding beta-propeller fold protein YncE
MVKKSISIRTVLLITWCLCGLLPLRAQSESDFRVEWMAAYPGTEEEQRFDLGERVSRIVFGKKPRELIKPFNVMADDSLRFWILDQGAGGIFEVNKGKGSTLRSFKRAEQLYPSLVGLCRTNEGDLLFTDSRLNQVMRVTGDQLSSFGDSLMLEQPTGIACDPVRGRVWIVETGAHRVSCFSREGRLISVLGGRGTGPGRFNFPTFIWIDQQGQVYVVDSMNYRIQIFGPDGDFIGAFGELGDATGFMARPKGIATDSRGHIYVADALFHAVQIFDRQGNFLYSFGRQGQGRGEFWMPTGLYIDRQDHIYVADSYNARIQIFKLEKR